MRLKSKKGLDPLILTALYGHRSPSVTEDPTSTIVPNRMLAMTSEKMCIYTTQSQVQLYYRYKIEHYY